MTRAKQNKKASTITLDNVLSLIIFIVGIILIVAGIFKVYNLVGEARESRSAETLLDKILTKAKSVEVGEETEVTLQGFKHDTELLLVAFNKDQAKAPEKCFFNNCLCICGGLSLTSPEEIEKLCQEGVCKQSDTKISINSKKVIQIPLPYAGTPLGGYQSNELKIELNAIDIPQTLFKLKIKKPKENEVVIYR
ncbi:hypothetical protein D6817_03535 [Candidatus Pacearchaeota archaeon]|nr:MAG: hypothetical protein D6817_03535 [Candidatus Pacearchaeota archaeon]